ncbi:MAG: hypothetical protein WCO67_13425 [Betaproteobacteria bacterium]
MKTRSTSTLGSILDELKAAYAIKEVAEELLHLQESKNILDDPKNQRLRKRIADAKSSVVKIEAKLEPFRLAVRSSELSRTSKPSAECERTR